MTKPNYTHIAILLDNSGSMSNIASETKQSVLQFIEAQKKFDGECTLTLQLFDSVVHSPVLNFARLNDIQEFNYWPGGWTALIDAMYDIIERTGRDLAFMAEHNRPSKVLIVIMTDGEENYSKLHTYQQVADKIAHQTSQYQWQFVFLGANQDAIKTARQFNIAPGCAASYVSSGVGTHKLFDNLSKDIYRYRSSLGPPVCANFVSQDTYNALNADLAEAGQKTNSPDNDKFVQAVDQVMRDS